MLNFSRWTPTLGCFFPPDTQKVLKTSTSSSVRPWLRGSSYSSQLKWISISMRQSTVGLKCWWLRRCCWRVLPVTKHPVFWKGDFWIMTGPLLFVHSQAYRDITAVHWCWPGWWVASGVTMFCKVTHECSDTAVKITSYTYRKGKWSPWLLLVWQNSSWQNIVDIHVLDRIKVDKIKVVKNRLDRIIVDIIKVDKIQTWQNKSWQKQTWQNKSWQNTDLTE